MWFLKMSFAFFGLMIVPLAAQTTASPQQSRAQSPNMPQAHETVPERGRPKTPASTEQVKEDAKSSDPAQRPKEHGGSAPFKPQRTTRGSTTQERTTTA